MTTYELTELVDELETWWGKDSRWNRPKDLAADFERVSFTAGRNAIRALRDQGFTHKPGPVDFLTACREAQRLLPKVSEVPEHCSHVWAQPSILDAVWADECVRCHMTRPAKLCSPHLFQGPVCAYCGVEVEDVKDAA
jgi:hypothetical protein